MKNTMARPHKNNAEYFSHDADMRNDKAVKAVRRKFGLTGYAIYNMILETLTDAEDFRVDISDDEMELIAADFDVEVEELRDMIDYMLKPSLNLLQCDEHHILRCNTLDKRFKALLSRRQREREVVIGADNSKSHPGNPQSKVEESKVKDRIVEKNGGVFFNNDVELKKELMIPGQMLDTLLQIHHLTVEQVEPYIDLFIQKQRLKFPEGRLLVEYRGHLDNWISSEQRRQTHDSGRGGYKKEYSYNEALDLIHQGKAVNFKESFIKGPNNKYTLK